MPKNTSIKLALISVSDKSGLIDFAKQLVEFNIKLIATSGTAEYLNNSGIPATDIGEFTGSQELLKGRVKSLHPKIHAGLLARDTTDDKNELAQLNIPLIDLIVVNLYPFPRVINKPNTTFEEAIENIDIGGPTMIRAAAKNAERVTVIVDLADYMPIIEEIRATNGTYLETRRRLARKAFALTADYDKTISDYLVSINRPVADVSDANEFPAMFTPSFDKIIDLRYGENPQQSAALYSQTLTQPGTLAAADQLQGKPLSYNNLLDADAAFECVRAYNPDQPAVVIVKHATPCGAAQAATLSEAYQLAYNTDPESAFGGIIACNQPLDKPTAQAICHQQFAEVIIAPQVHVDALEICAKKPNLRLLTCGSKHNRFTALSMRTISGGLLVQNLDFEQYPENFSVVTEREPTEEELHNLLFAWETVRFVKSNGIVLAKDCATIGIGSGQTSRIFSTKVAIMKAREAKLPINGAVMASDAFFPFADSIELACTTGITAIIQPGGSRRDKEVIATANHHNMAMVFTGIRHFRH